MNDISMPELLVDVDGVLLDFLGAFNRHLQSLGYKHICDDNWDIHLNYENLSQRRCISLLGDFLRSPATGKLRAFGDALEYLPRIAELGCKITAITSFPNEQNDIARRWGNLSDRFGDIFDDVICVAYPTKKSTVLVKWQHKNAIWVEDNVDNYHMGEKIGIKSYLITRPYNRDAEVANRVTGWQNIFTDLTS